MARWSTLALALLAAGCTPSVRPGAVGPTVDLVVAATTDVHGHVRGWDYYDNRPDSTRGLVRAATIVDSLRDAAPGRVILVDAGDLLQGNPFAYVAARVDTASPNSIVVAMNALHYDAAAIGNHEFNYGLAALDRATSQARFPLLATNAYRPDGRRRFTGWTMLTRGGVTVGIVGATTPGSMLWDRDNLAGKVVIRDIVPEIRTAVEQVRKAGADVVIVLLHSGLDERSSYDTVGTGVASENVSARVAHEVPGIDLIVYGHSHKQMADTVIGGTLLMQPKNWATSVAVAHLVLTRQHDGWAVWSKTASLVAVAGHRENATLLSVTQRAHEDVVRYATAPIGVTDVAWRADSARVADTPLMDFILEVERRAAGAQLASTAAFSLDATIAPGPVTVARIAALYPYDNTLRAVKISGQQLREYLEQTARYFRRTAGGRVVVDSAVPGFNYDMLAGVNYTLDLTRPPGDRVTQLDYDGRAVAPADSFTLALNNYRQTGGGGYAMLRGAPVVYDRQLEIRQLLIDEVRRRGTLRPADYFHSNWKIVPPRAVTDAYRSMHQRTLNR